MEPLRSAAGIMSSRYKDPRADVEIRSKEGVIFKVHMYALASERCVTYWTGNNDVHIHPIVLAAVQLISSTLINDLFTMQSDDTAFTDHPSVDLPASANLVRDIIDFLVTPEHVREIDRALRISNEDVARDFFASVDYLGCEVLRQHAIKSLANTLPLVERFQWAWQNNHNEIMLRGALEGWNNGEKRVSAVLEERRRMMRALPVLYMQEIAARTFTQHKQYSTRWMENKADVEDFIRTIKSEQSG